MSELSPKAREMHAKLLQRYLESFPQKQADLENGWDRLQTNSWSTESLALFRTPVHRLAGSAGSYGLKELGRVARQLDASLKTTTPTREQRAEIKHQFEALMSAVAEAQKKA